MFFYFCRLLLKVLKSPSHHIMKQHNVSLIIVPDIHGRPFWKEVFNYDAEVVFLGDYLDPFTSEGIYPWDALDNFTYIVSYAKSHPKTHLLLGNHDLCYSVGRHICNSRCDYENYDTIRHLFLNEKGLFQMAFFHSVNGRRFFMSHAGISLGWYGLHRDLFPHSYEETLQAELINGLYQKGALVKALGEIGAPRGGRSTYGSMVWADFHEQMNPEQKASTDIIQIVGHTQVVSGPINLEQEYNLYNVDARQCIYIDEEGILRLLSDGSPL